MSLSTENNKGEGNVDLTLINFPSDRLTLNEIRKRHCFGKGEDLYDFFEQLETTDPFMEMIAIERIIVKAIFNEVVETGECFSFTDATDADGMDLLDSLRKAYVLYGIVNGEHEANLLIQNFEEQAVRQAQQFTGKVR